MTMTRKPPVTLDDGDLDKAHGGGDAALAQNDLDNGRLIAAIGVAATKDSRDRFANVETGHFAPTADLKTSFKSS